MKVRIRTEHGYKHAAIGLSLCKRQPVRKMPSVMARLAGKGGGHDKFLESIVLWIDITAPRGWWQQFDTYRHVTKQSESTMNDGTTRVLTQADFERPIPPDTLDRLNNLAASGDMESLENERPEGFLQRRMVCVCYKTMRNIIDQRKNHKKKLWKFFETEILAQAKHPELLTSA
jgi:hypothetical protein